MAGGRGKRISSIASDIPKPMIPIQGKPVLEHEINCLREQGFTDIIITVSHLSEKITDYFGSGEKFGVSIKYYIEDKPLGNAGALFRFSGELNDDLLLINADSVFDVDFERFVEYHYKKGGLVTLFTHPNSHPFDSGLLAVDDNYSVTKWYTKEETRPKWYKNRVNAGLHIISPKIFEIYSNLLYDSKSENNKIDLDRHILKPLCGTGRMFCYDSPEYIKDMGTPERYALVCDDFASGKPQKRNLKKQQRAIFIDRDGTINKYVGFLRNINDFELLPGVSEAIKAINESGMLAVVVSNQPVIARGEITFSELDEIHNKMETLLGADGAYLDKIYFCPHHPDRGYDGEILQLKVDCECRKPKAGMLLKAKQELNIDLCSSWMIGDSEADIKAGKAAGCKTALIGDEQYSQDMNGKSLKELVERILNK